MLISPASLSIIFFFFLMWKCESVSVWEFDWADWLTFFFINNLAVQWVCDMPALITIYIYIYIYFGSCCTTITMFVLCVLCCMFVGCVLCVCVLCVHILPKFQFWKFQFWNWNLEKNNLNFFWKSYNINNIGFFFFVFFLKDFTIQLLLINIILVAVH